MSDPVITKEQLLEHINKLNELLNRSENERFSSACQDRTIQSILNAVPHVVVGLVNREIVFCNDAVKNVFHFTPEEVIGKRTDVFYRNEEDFRRIGEEFYSNLATRKCYANEIICRTKEGAEIICLLSAARFGEVLEQNKIVVMYEDITIRKKAEQALTLFRNLMHQSSDLIFIADPRTAKILDANKQVSVSLGYSHEELLGKSIIDIHEFFDKSSWKAHIEKLKNFQDMLKEGFHIRKDGSRFPVEVSIRYIILEEKPYLIAIARDITQRKKKQELLDAVNVLKEKLLASLPLKDKLDMITRTTADILGVKAAGIWLSEPGETPEQGNVLQLTSSVGIEGYQNIPMGSCRIGKIALGVYNKFLTNDVGNDPEMPEQDWLKETGIFAFSGHRILSQGNVYGVFAIFHESSIDPYIDAILEDITNTIGQVLSASSMEELIIDKNKFMSNIIDSFSHPFYVINVADYSIAFSNKAASSGKESKNTCYELIHKKQSPCDGIDYVCPLEQLKKTKQPVVTKHVHVDASGTEKQVEVYCYPVFDEKGNLVRAIKYSLDGTGR